MRRFEAVRDALRDGTLEFQHLDAVQLVKHAFGLRSAVQRDPAFACRAVLVYLYAEPNTWANGKPIPDAAKATHCQEIEQFAALVAGDEVAFRSCSYRDFLGALACHSDPAVRAHADAIAKHFRV
jgi:hypothetical protein